MNTDYYKTFYYVALYKNITKAANSLFTSQPNVSRVIKALETELGCTLLTRNKHGVELTREGEVLFSYVSHAFMELSKAEEQISNTLSIEKGNIYIGTTITALYAFLFDFLDIFREKYPSVTFKIKTDSSNNTIENLKNGIVDLAFVTTPNLIPKPLVSYKIMEFEDILIAGHKFDFLKGRPLHFSDLETYPFISLAKGTQLREFIDDIFNSYQIDIKPDFEPDSAGMIIPLTKRNWGLAIVPETMAKTAIKQHDVIELNLVDKIPKRQVCMVTNPTKLQTKASRELARMIIN